MRIGGENKNHLSKMWDCGERYNNYILFNVCILSDVSLSMQQFHLSRFVILLTLPYADKRGCIPYQCQTWRMEFLRLWFNVERASCWVHKVKWVRSLYQKVLHPWYVNYNTSDKSFILNKRVMINNNRN